MRFSVVDARCSLESDVVSAVAVVFWVHLFQGAFTLFAEGLEQTLAALHSAESLRAHKCGLLAPDAAPMCLLFPAVARRPRFSGRLLLGCRPITMGGCEA